MLVVPDRANVTVGKIPEEYPNRQMQEPVTFLKYNDIRVNLLSLVTLNVWRRPLPQVLREEVMDPIGASNTWRWYGYEHSWITLDGQQIQSVSGGCLLRGGLVLNPLLSARFWSLFLHHAQR